MINNEIFTNELLQQTLAELTAAINDSTPSPNKCIASFLMGLKKRYILLSMAWVPKSYTETIQDYIIRK